MLKNATTQVENSNPMADSAAAPTSATDKLSATDKALLQIIKKHPGGIRMAGLIAASGWTTGRCSNALRKIRAMGLAGPTLGGNMVSAWATTDNLMAIKAERARVAEAARRQKDQRAEARRLSALARAAKDEIKERQRAEDEKENDAFAGSFVHRLVPAGEWARPQTNCQSSVFNLIVGAQESAAGWVDRAVDLAHNIGATP